MRNTKIKNNKMLLGIIILSIFILMTAVLALNFGDMSTFAYAATEIECCESHDHSAQTNLSNISGKQAEQRYLSVHYTDGTMGAVVDETYITNKTYFEPLSFTYLQKTTVRSSGRPDHQSLVAVFLGDGFTVSEQQDFLDRVTQIANYMVTVEPFNYYKDYLTVYAVHSISNESGISGEVGGTFACLDSAGNPATPQCTPIDSVTFNCTHGRDTFYNSYYQWSSSTNRVMLEMSSQDRERVRADAKKASESVNMIQVLANSQMSGGTGEMTDLGVALTSIERGTVGANWMDTVMHEFGHSFGGLWDEYWNDLEFLESYPNVTNNPDASTVKWSQWVGYKNVGVYPFANSDWDNGNHDQTKDPWFRPHQNCMMRQLGNPFCPVCVQELLGKMEIATGLTLFNTTNISTNNIRIDKLNISVSGTFDIPERLNGRIVTEIGSYAFSNAELSQITIPSSVITIGDGAFRNCNNLTSISRLNNVQTIGNNAFRGCDSLTNIYLSANLLSLGEGVFAGCNNLNINVSSNNPNYYSASNILYNKNQSRLIATGKIASEFTIPNTITEIAPYSFDSNNNLSKVYFNHAPTIDNNAFANCDNLDSVYFNTYSIPTMGTDCFANNDFVLYAPYVTRETYEEIFANYTNNVSSIDVQISFISNGETIGTSNVLYGSFIENLLEPTRAGYEFYGWYDNTAFSGEPYLNGALWNVVKDTKLYAKWEIIEYSIRYNLKGGVQASSNPLTYTVESNDIVLRTPTKDGYTFVNWRSGENIINTIPKGSCGDINLTADWAAKEYSVTLNANGGSNNGESSFVAKYDSTFSTLSMPTKIGYTFEGWYDSQTGGTKYMTASGECTRLWDKTSDTTLYARWAVKSYEIKINGNGSITWLGASGLSDVQCSIEYGTVLSAINLIYTFKNSNHGFKEGNIFTRFKYNNGNLDWASIPDLGENGAIITIEPVWEKETHTITYDTLCAIVLEKVEAGYDDDISLPIVERNGYEFIGWYTAPSGGNKINWTKMPDLTPTSQSNGLTTVFAQYELIEYNITYEQNGGTNLKNCPYKYDIEKDTILGTAERIGYSFSGWYLDSSFMTEITSLMGYYGNKTLYAKWEINFYRIEFDRQGGTGGINSINANYNNKMPLCLTDTNEKTGYNEFLQYMDMAPIMDKYGLVQYTISFDIKSPVPGPVLVYQQNGSDSKYSFNKYVNVTQNYTRQYITVTPNISNSSLTQSMLAFYGEYGKGRIVSVKNVKIELGDVATPWITGGAIPQRTGYTFQGYYSEVNGGGVKYYNADMTSANNWTKTSGATLYAKWTGKTYTVKINHMIEGVAIETITATFGQAMPLIDTHSKPAHVIAGFYTEKDGTGTQYYDSTMQSLRNWDADNDSTILYAKWVRFIVFNAPPNNESFNSGGLSTSWSGWKLLNILPSTKEGDFEPLDYRDLQDLGYTKLYIECIIGFVVTGTVDIELRCVNTRTNDVIHNSGAVTYQKGETGYLEFGFEIDLSDINNGDVLKWEINYKKLKALGIGHFSATPRFYYYSAS